MKKLPLLCSLYGVALGVATAACGTETPTTAVVANAYSSKGDASSELTVYRVWYTTTLFNDPVAPGEESAPLRTIPANEFAYAILAPGWDPSSGDPPSVFLPLRSRGKLSVARGETLRIEVSDRTFDGRCDAGKPLSQSDADFITTRIFPGQFTGVTYDAETCTTTATEDERADASTNGKAASDGGPLGASTDRDSGPN